MVFMRVASFLAVFQFCRLELLNVTFRLRFLYCLQLLKYDVPRCLSDTLLDAVPCY